jgi:ATP-binding cassette subfamily B protein
MLALGWRYRSRCLGTLLLQALLLGLSLSGLGLMGLAIDVLRHAVDPSCAAPAFPFGLRPPTAWPPLGTIAAIAGGIVVLATVNGGLRYLAAVAGATLSQKIIAQLRADVFEKMQRMSFRFFDSNDVSSTINRVTGDVPAISSFIDGVILRVIITLMSLAALLAYMLCRNVPLTLACLAPTPLLWIGSIVFSRSVRPSYLRISQLMDRLVLRLTENVQGIHVVKGFVRQREQIQQFAEANRAVYDQQHEIFWKISLFQPYMGLVTHASMVILLAYGGWLVLRGELPLGGGLFVFSGLLQQFSDQVGQITNVANSIQTSLTGARRVFQVLDTPSDLTSPARPVRLRRPRGAVRFDHVTFGYRSDRPVLCGVSFEVEPGECVAIVGGTGSGKSTLLSLIPRFYDVTSGRVAIDGLDVRRLGLDDLRRNIGMVFQESFLFSDTVSANIAFGRPDASPEQVDRAARVAGALEFILDLPRGRDTMLEEQGSNLSGGQRQRLAIARAVLLNPPILILDDATAAVDPGTEAEICRAIEQATRGRTTLLSTHRVSMLKRADRILVLDRGRIQQAGSHEMLLRSCEVYRRLVAMQASKPESQTGRLRPWRGN